MLIVLVFSFPSPLMGGDAARTSALGSQWTMSHGCASLILGLIWFFSHDILAPINPFDFSLFEAQGLDVFQHTLKSESDMKTLEPVQKFKTLIHTPWKGFFI